MTTREPRIIAYIRVSSNKQDVENQRFEITRYAAAKNIPITEFVEETVSAYKVAIRDRKLYTVLNELQAGDTLIVSETSRISRRLIETLNTLQDLLDRRISVIAVKENYVFADDINSKVMAFAFGLAAEIERNFISARTKEALARKKAEGVTLGRPPGSSDPTHRKLWGKDDQILDWMDHRVPKAAMARMLHVTRHTLSNYIDERNLTYQLRVRRLSKTDK